MFKKNVGGTDHIVRIIAGLVLIASAATGTVGLWGSAFTHWIDE